METGDAIATGLLAGSAVIFALRTIKEIYYDNREIAVFFTLLTGATAAAVVISLLTH